MPIFLAEEELQFPIGENHLKYARLVQDDLAKLRYLYQVRGEFDDTSYNKACMAVALRGWDVLYGEKGLIPWPLRIPSHVITTQDADKVQKIVEAYPQLTQTEREQLHGSYYVVTHLPMEIALSFSAAVQALEPEQLKKKWVVSSNGTSFSKTNGQEPSSPAETAASSADETASNHRVMTEA